MIEFQQARIKLTLWYMLISAILLAIFTLAAIGAEHQGFAMIQHSLGSRGPRPVQMLVPMNNSLQERIDRFEDNFVMTLLGFDLVALAIVAIASYFLSSRTLEPIQRMVKQQQDFAADASHELRTPLTTISMEIEALKRNNKKLPMAVGQTMQSIKDEVRRMAGIVDGLLTLVRTQSDEVRASFQNVNLSSVTEAAVRQMEPLAAAKKLKYSADISSEILVRGDNDQLKQVCLILLDNAIKYTPDKGSVKISLHQNTNDAVLHIKDSGQGITKADLEHIFERFYRVDHGSDQGNGLGLAIAKKIVDQSDGKISAKSEVKKGSEFEVRWPILKK